MPEPTDSDLLKFADDDDTPPLAAPESPGPWTVVIVDDEPEIHRVTELALRGFEFEGRSLAIVNAYSGEEAKRVMAEQPDAAVLLLDVVMETDTAGLDVVKHVRGVIGNKNVRIVMRTGQPGLAPEHSVVAEYDINDYREKTEITSQRLFTVLHSALRSYRDIVALSDSRDKIETQLRELQSLADCMHKLAEGDMTVTVSGDYSTSASRDMAYAIQVFRDNAIQRQRLEQQLRQSQKLEAIGTLAGGVAHEFNNLLLPMIGLTEATVQALPAGDKSRMNLEAVVEAGERAASLVAEIVAFSRDTDADTKQTPTQIPVIVDEVLAALGPTVPPNITIETNIDPSVGPIVCDPSNVHEIILNIANNAVTAMQDEGGTLTVSLEQTDRIDDRLAAVLEIGNGPFVKATVSDTGHGMDEDILARIYDPFFTTKPVGDGTGLGLFKAHEFIKRLGGAITATSQPNRGATFEIYLPVAAQPGAEQLDAPAHGRSAAGAGRA